MLDGLYHSFKIGPTIVQSITTVQTVTLPQFYATKGSKVNHETTAQNLSGLVLISSNNRFSTRGSSKWSRGKL